MSFQFRIQRGRDCDASLFPLVLYLFDHRQQNSLLDPPASDNTLVIAAVKVVLP